MIASRRPHLPIEWCQPHSSGRSWTIGCAPSRTMLSSRPGWLTRCVPWVSVCIRARWVGSLTPDILPAPPAPHSSREDGGSGRMLPVSTPREVTVLGSTGSIGRQAIAVAQQNPDRLRITALAAGGSDVGLLAEQALTLGVRTVAVARATAAQDLQLAFYAEASKRGWSRGEYPLPEILA